MVPTRFKTAVVIPTLKQPNRDPVDPKNYCPISNLPFLNKILERTLAAQLQHHMSQPWALQTAPIWFQSPPQNWGCPHQNKWPSHSCQQLPHQQPHPSRTFWSFWQSRAIPLNHVTEYLVSLTLLSPGYPRSSQPWHAPGISACCPSIHHLYAPSWPAYLSQLIQFPLLCWWYPTQPNISTYPTPESNVPPPLVNCLY